VVDAAAMAASAATVAIHIRHNGSGNVSSGSNNGCSGNVSGISDSTSNSGGSGNSGSLIIYMH
jgi:hypothetical protein